MMFRRLLSATLAAGTATLIASTAPADTPGPSRTAGRAAVYGQLSSASLEQVSTAGDIKRVTAGNAAPTEIWRVLEHGERTECLSCIPGVSTLLWNDHAKTREISAWWLRRRIFGVFGPGEVYSQVVQAVGDPTVPEGQRAYAAEALGEFLTYAGLEPLADAAVTDDSPRVRLAAVREADQIIVLDEGRIVERGAHQSLLRLGGRYAAMYRRELQQAKNDEGGERVNG